MGRCVICKTVHQKGSGTTFHRFPQGNIDLQRKWVENINKGFPGSRWKLGKDSLVCSKHFEECCFDRKGYRVRLDENSVPTIFGEPHCAICNKKKSQWPQLSFHKFPVKDEAVLQRWVENITFDSPTRIKNSLVCSDHFEKSSFVRSKGKICLRKGSIPTKFETNTKRGELDETDDEAARNEQRPLFDSITSTPKRMKLHIVENSVSGTCELNAAKVSVGLEIISTRELRDLTVDSRVDEKNCKNNISVRPEPENGKQLEIGDGDREQSDTGTPDSNRDHGSEISPKTCTRLIALDHNYFDSPETLRKKLAAARKVVHERGRVIQSQRKRLKRMLNKIISLQQLVSVLRDKK